MNKERKSKACVISSYAFIVTNNNYGALLQYYAIAKYLKSRGLLSYWLRYKVDDLTIKKRVKYILETKSLRTYLNYIRCHKDFMQFVDSYLEVSDKEFYSIEELCNNLPEADYYITGSDQVWAGTLEANYLRFVPKNQKKIAYSASFGKDELELNHQKKIKPWLLDFDFISVRESSGVDICNTMGVRAKHLIDPTFLLSKDQYPISTDAIIESDRYIYCYFTNISNSLNEVYWSQIVDFATNVGCKIIVTPIQGCERFFKNATCVYPSPENWLRYYRDAEFVITNTFHGSVFATIFEKKFLSILQEGYSSRQNTRIISILTYLGIESRVYNPSGIMEEQIIKEINWSSVTERINANRKRSDEFVNNFLNKDSNDEK